MDANVHVLLLMEIEIWCHKRSDLCVLL